MSLMTSQGAASAGSGVRIARNAAKTAASVPDVRRLSITARFAHPRRGPCVAVVSAEAIATILAVHNPQTAYNAYIMQNTVRTSQPTVLEALRSAFASVTNKISVRREQNYADIKFTDSVERDLAQLEYRRHGYRW